MQSVKILIGDLALKLRAINICWELTIYIWVFLCSSVGKESTCNAGDPGSIPGLGRFPGEGNDNPLQYSCLENPMDRGAWWSTVHGVTRVGHDSTTTNYTQGIETGML